MTDLTKGIVVRGLSTAGAFDKDDLDQHDRLQDASVNAKEGNDVAKVAAQGMSQGNFKNGFAAATVADIKKKGGRVIKDEQKGNKNHCQIFGLALNDANSSSATTVHGMNCDATPVASTDSLRIATDVLTLRQLGDIADGKPAARRSGRRIPCSPWRPGTTGWKTGSARRAGAWPPTATCMRSPPPASTEPSPPQSTPPTPASATSATPPSQRTAPGTNAYRAKL